MKLLHIPNYYFPNTGGIEQVCRDIVHSLQGCEIEQKVICFNHDAKRGELCCKGIETKTDEIDNIEIRRCGSLMKLLLSPYL